MNDTDTRYADLEQRLRAAAGAVPARPVPAGAWVELQSRLATRDGHHGRRFLAAAAVVALLLGLVGAAALLDDGSPAGGPASGSGGGDPWATENILGEPVVAETLTMGGQQVRHELVLTDTDGKGPSLCDRFVSGSGSAGGCSARDARADDPAVAFDWLSGTTGGGDIHGVLGAVDDRVQKVQVWMSNGDETLATLHPTGWEGTKMFALTMQDANGPVPQRLVAYSDATGTVLQTVDLADQFGKDWLCADGPCGSTVTGLWPFPGSGGPSDVQIRLGVATATISVSATPGNEVQTSQALRAGSLAAWQLEPTVLVVVTGPEVVMVQVHRDDEVVGEVKAAPSMGSPWLVAVLRDLPADIADGTALVSGVDLVALDVTGHVIDEVALTARSG